MAERVWFKAYKGNALVLHTWAVEGVAEQIEREAFQARLDRGELTHVEVIRPALKMTSMLRKTRG